MILQTDNQKLLYILPFIIILWNNIHGGCVAGLGLFVFYIIGEFLDKKPIKKYLIALFFVAIVYLINPWGFDFIKFTIEGVFVDRSWISEWQSPFLGDISDIIVRWFMYKIFLMVKYLSNQGGIYETFFTQSKTIYQTQ